MKRTTRDQWERECGGTNSQRESNSRESRRSLQMSMIADHGMNWEASGENRYETQCQKSDRSGLFGLLLKCKLTQRFSPLTFIRVPLLSDFLSPLCDKSLLNPFPLSPFFLWLPTFSPVSPCCNDRLSLSEPKRTVISFSLPFNLKAFILIPFIFAASLLLIVDPFDFLLLSFSSSESRCFLTGIPYASPPVGKLRFMPPVTPAHWTGVRSANAAGPVCPQKLPDISNETRSLSSITSGRLNQLKRLLPSLQNQSEDCLYLNIYAPVSGQSSFRPLSGLPLC